MHGIHFMVCVRQYEVIRSLQNSNFATTQIVERDADMRSGQNIHWFICKYYVMP